MINAFTFRNFIDPFFLSIIYILVRFLKKNYFIAVVCCKNDIFFLLSTGSSYYLAILFCSVYSRQYVHGEKSIIQSTYQLEYKYGIWYIIPFVYSFALVFFAFKIVALNLCDSHLKPTPVRKGSVKSLSLKTISIDIDRDQWKCFRIPSEWFLLNFLYDLKINSNLINGLHSSK